MKKLLFIALLISHSWGAFSYYKTKTTKTAEVPSDQTSFAVMIHDTLTAARVQNSKGFDIGFYSDQCTTKLYWQMEYFNSSTGELVAWVKLSTVHHSSADVIYECFDDNTISTWQGGDSTQVWNSNFKSVYHLSNSNGSTLTGVDATTTYNATVNSATSTTGNIDGGAACNGTTGDLTATSSSIGTGDWTWETWVKTSFSGGYQGAISDASTTLYIVSPNNGGAMMVYDGNGEQTSGVTVNSGAWRFAVAQRTGTTIKFYIDGTVSSDTYSNSNSDTRTSITIGSDGAPTNNHAVSMDEVRIMKYALSADWIKIEYNNQKPASDFFTSSAETSNTGGPTRAQLMRRVW